jgi:hypothetical protein
VKKDDRLAVSRRRARGTDESFDGVRTYASTNSEGSSFEHLISWWRIPNTPLGKIPWTIDMKMVGISLVVLVVTTSNSGSLFSCAVHFWVELKEC